MAQMNQTEVKGRIEDYDDDEDHTNDSRPGNIELFPYASPKVETAASAVASRELTVIGPKLGLPEETKMEDDERDSVDVVSLEAPLRAAAVVIRSEVAEQGEALSLKRDVRCPVRTPANRTEYPTTSSSTDLKRVLQAYRFPPVHSRLAVGYRESP